MFTVFIGSSKTYQGLCLLVISEVMQPHKVKEAYLCSKCIAYKIGFAFYLLNAILKCADMRASYNGYYPSFPSWYHGEALRNT